MQLYIVYSGLVNTYFTVGLYAPPHGDYFSTAFLSSSSLSADFLTVTQLGTLRPSFVFNPIAL
jgi:hypothetical protein